MDELIFRFLIGGTLVSAFALVGDAVRPKSFAGLFGAAPSIALATLGLTVATEGRNYAAIEARSMIAGAIALISVSTTANTGGARSPERWAGSQRMARNGPCVPRRPRGGSRSRRGSRIVP